MTRVLLVEDDHDIAFELKDWLVENDYLVEHTSSGPEAIDHLEFHKYDAIVLDGQLPGMSGVEVCAAYRAAGGLTPVIMMTGRTREEAFDACMKAGANFFLEKPFDLDELLTIIDRAVREHELETRTLN